MYFTDKNLSRIGSSSLGVIIPREWLFSMGLHKKGDALRLSFDPKTRRIYVDAHPEGVGASNNALPSVNINDGNDYTPQPKKKYPPSPHPGYTPAQWDKCHHLFKKQELEWLEEAKEAGVDVTSLSNFELFKQKKQNELDNRFHTRKQEPMYIMFRDLPEDMQKVFNEQIKPYIVSDCYIYKEGKGYNARTDWTNAVNKSLELSNPQVKANYLLNVIKSIKKQYNDDLDEL